MAAFKISRSLQWLVPGRPRSRYVPAISANQRDALYAQIMDGLKINGDLSRLSESPDLSAVRVQVREVVDDLTLILEALSWGETSSGDVELTLPPDLLRRAFTRHRERAFRQKEAGSKVDSVSTRADLIFAACNQVLDGLAQSRPNR